MKKIYLTRKNPASHFAFLTAVKPTGFGDYPDYPDNTDIVEIELTDAESLIGKTLAYGEIAELSVSNEQFNAIFNQ